MSQGEATKFLEEWKGHTRQGGLDPLYRLRYIPKPPIITPSSSALTMLSGAVISWTDRLSGTSQSCSKEHRTTEIDLTEAARLSPNPTLNEPLRSRTVLPKSYNALG
jgi:hypothetical protein